MSKDKGDEKNKKEKNMRKNERKEKATKRNI